MRLKHLVCLSFIVGFAVVQVCEDARNFVPCQEVPKSTMTVLVPACVQVGPVAQIISTEKTKAEAEAVKRILYTPGLMGKNCTVQIQEIKKR